MASTAYLASSTSNDAMYSSEAQANPTSQVQGVQHGTGPDTPARLEPNASTSTATTRPTNAADAVSQSAAAATSDDRASPSSSRSYPSGFPHCSYCFVAEFDIDKGSTLSYQYPAPSGHDEHTLAELMLPDGVHARSEDWTVFFLPIDSAAPSATTNDASLHSPQQSSVKQQPKSRENLLYVLNLVRTKHDTTVRRGALVKAIAIATRHPFIHVFKPALLLALDEYYRTPGVDVLVRLHDALNSLDISSMPSFSRDEKLILRASDRRDLFEERFTLNARSLTNLRPLMGIPGHAGQMASTQDEDERQTETYDSSGTTQLHSRSGSGSSRQSSEEQSSKGGLASAQHNYVAPISASTATGRRTPHLPHRPSLASLRLGNGSGILKRKTSAAAQTVDAQQAALGTSGVRSISSSMPRSTMSNVKDTHVWETSVSYGKIQELPIRIPTDVFDEEVGEYSLIHLINTFGATNVVGPQHPHLHTNGNLTSPIILLFNAVITGKRIIFLGHNQPAQQVAGHVLSLCALASGCGTGFRGIVSRCFPYANLASIDEFEKIPGYIAGVTNPRFEELRIWDVLCNIETGKITVSKDIEPAPPLRPAGGPPVHGETFSSLSGAISAMNVDGEGRLTRAPSEPDVSFGSTASSNTGTIKGRDRSGTASITVEARSDAHDNAFMEEVMLTIAGRYSERYLRARFAEYAANFIRLAARHEEYFYGQTSLGPPNQPCLNGQLGSGSVYTDREAELKDIQVNAHRVEGWRATDLYTLFVADEANRLRHVTNVGFDVGHQVARLRRGKRVQTSEAELIFTAFTDQVRSQAQLMELLSLLPAHHGGLLPLSNGLLHPSDVVRTAAVELLVRLAGDPIGRKYLQTLNVFHRLTFARALHESGVQQQQQQQQHGPHPTAQDGTGVSPNAEKTSQGYSTGGLHPTHLTSTPMSVGGSYQSAGSQNAANAAAAAANARLNGTQTPLGMSSGGPYPYGLSAAAIDMHILNSSSRSTSPANPTN